MIQPIDKEKLMIQDRGGNIPRVMCLNRLFNYKCQLKHKLLATEIHSNSPLFCFCFPLLGLHCHILVKVMCPCEPLCRGTSTLSLKFTSMQTHLYLKLHSMQSENATYHDSRHEEVGRRGQHWILRPREYLVPFLTAHCSCPLPSYTFILSLKMHTMFHWEGPQFLSSILSITMEPLASCPLIFTVGICLLVPLTLIHFLFFFPVRLSINLL